MLQTVLIILTLGHADGAHLSLTMADDPAACQQKAAALDKVLTDAGYTVGAHRCVETDLQFTLYRPGATEMSHRFEVTLPKAAGAELRELGADDACTAVPDSDPAVFCAVSAQQLLTD